MPKPNASDDPSLAEATKELQALAERHGAEGFAAPGDGVAGFPIGRFLDLLVQIIQRVRPFIPEGADRS